MDEAAADAGLAAVAVAIALCRVGVRSQCLGSWKLARLLKLAIDFVGCLYGVC